MMLKVTLVMSAMAAITAMPVLADQTGVDFTNEWPAHLGAIGILGSMAWYLMGKVIPGMSKKQSEDIALIMDMHKETSGEITTELKGIRADSERHHEAQNKILTEAISRYK